MLFYVVLVAVLNLCLGYAIAYSLGRGPHAREQGERPLHISMADGSLAPPEPDMAAEETTIETVAAEQIEVEPAASDEDPSIDLSAYEQAPTQAEQVQEEAAEEPEEPAALPQEPAEEAREKTAVEASIDDVLRGLQEFREQLRDLDNEVRSCSEDTVAMNGCVKKLREANDEYLEKTHEAAERLQQQSEEEGELAEASEAIQRAIETQTAEVKATYSNLTKIELETNLETKCQKLLSETSKLDATNTNISDDLDRARMKIAREEGWIENVDRELLTDDLTQIASRSAFEAAIEDIWRKDPNRSRELVVAMIDLDRHGKINEEHGLDVGDAVIRAVATILAAGSKADQLVARYGGQKYVVLFQDDSIKQATNTVEHMRQILEETSFQRKGKELDVNASCAVTAVLKEDTVETIFERLNSTVKEAKRYGRNRTFLHDGEYPGPVAPPNIKVQSQTYQV